MQVLGVFRLIIGIVFSFQGFFTIYSYVVNKSIGVIYGGLAYLFAGILSIILSSWLPLIIGYISVHIIQKLGFNPYYNSNLPKDVFNLKKLPLQKLLCVLLNNYNKIHSINDMITLLPENCLHDISDRKDVKEMNKAEKEELGEIENHKNRFFQFKVTENILGELDIDFVKDELANVRIQIFFDENDLELKEEYLIKIKELVEEIVSVDLEDNYYDKYLPSDTYDYFGKTENGLEIGLRNLPYSISLVVISGEYGFEANLEI